jgi:pimeloyl-ACP methyl ester carboxylesterase
MADDTVALLKQLNIEEVDIFGYSMGAGIALHIAIQYPDMVRNSWSLRLLTTIKDSNPGFLQEWRT